MKQLSLFAVFIVAVLTGSNVVLVDTSTMHRILEERLGELLSKYNYDDARVYQLKTTFEDIHDRIDSITTAEGFEG